MENEVYIMNTLLSVVLGRDSALYEKGEDTKMMYPNGI